MSCLDRNCPNLEGALIWEDLEPRFERAQLALADVHGEFAPAVPIDEAAERVKRIAERDRLDAARFRALVKHEGVITQTHLGWFTSEDSAGPRTLEALADALIAQEAGDDD